MPKGPRGTRIKPISSAWAGNEVPIKVPDKISYEPYYEQKPFASRSYKVAWDEHPWNMGPHKRRHHKFTDTARLF